ncbi:MAG: hypothetical protein SGI91_12855 [Alphaproteobacteria bacterium]|nr:hypothetical protein [Alphaproteobacteria bacterium]
MTTTVTGLFEARTDAANAVAEIKAAGVSKEEISIVTNKVEGQSEERSAGDKTVDNNMAETGVGDGAAIGGVLGGGAGLLAGLGLLTIPGIGPVLGVGWLITTAIGTAVGASGGGIIGALVGAGVDKDDAQIYVERVRSGGTLVSVRVPDKSVAAIEAIMVRHKRLERPFVAMAGDGTIKTTTTRVTTERPILRTTSGV